jgi:hypothetical protein
LLGVNLGVLNAFTISLLSVYRPDPPTGR